jgi:hypothetical protein
MIATPLGGLIPAFLAGFFACNGRKLVKSALKEAVKLMKSKKTVKSTCVGTAFLRVCPPGGI